MLLLFFYTVYSEFVEALGAIYFTGCIVVIVVLRMNGLARCSQSDVPCLRPKQCEKD